jgi:hypothetical protein
MFRKLTDIKRQSPEAVLANLKSSNQSESIQAGLSLVRTAKEYGLCLQDYLKIAIDPRQSKTPMKFDGLNGFESALLELGLPFRDDYSQGVLLQAASDSFQTYPGTRAMFPEVVDQMLRFKNRQDHIEKVEPLLAQSRTISGTELISTFVEDGEEIRATATIAEFGRIPVRTLTTSQSSVGIFKHGSGIRTSYEFERRASLDILTPYAARVDRELEISKVRSATNILLNGDGVNPAATAMKFSDFNGTSIADGTNPLSKQYKAFATWLVKRAKAGLPIDTIVGNLDMYLELLFMFTPTLASDRAEIEAMVARGGPGINLNIPLLNGSAQFVLSSNMGANKLLGYSRADTLEELIEAGSSISENERSIQNQSVVYVRSENTGYKIAMGDTRCVLDLAQ